MASHDDDLFVDTSGWFANFVHDSQRSTEVRALVEDTSGMLVASDFIVDELFTLLKTRGKFQKRELIWTALSDQELVTILPTTRADLDAAYAIYSKFSDKEWSFTDCLSYHFIHSMKFESALSLDHHFHEFGIVTVLP